jgi:quinol-cytochrome oxidoreductase complex cytochrome b subunit
MGSWIDDRLGWSERTAALAERRVPLHRVEYYVGGTALFLFLLQVLSGVLLLMHYHPSATEAHQSVMVISGALPFGSLIRGLHMWSSDLLVLALIAHVFVMLLRRSFRAPSELLWVGALFALAIAGAAAFTGSLLVWSQWSYEQARVASAFMGKVPVIGSWIHRFLLGGDMVSAATLNRAYGFHAGILPAAMTTVVLFHVVVARKRRAAEPEAQGRTIPLYPDFVVRQLTVWAGVLLLVVSLAVFWQRVPGLAANPAGPAGEGAGPPWYLASLHQIVRWAPADILGMEGSRFVVGTMVVVFLLAPLLPLADRRGSRETLAVASLLLVALLILTFYGLR